jgi:hypothetical protein
MPSHRCTLGTLAYTRGNRRQQTPVCQRAALDGKRLNGLSDTRSLAARTTSAAASAPTAAATAASAPAASLATDIAATRLAIAEACVQRRLSAWLAGAGLFELRRRREQKEARGAGERCVFVSSICRDHLAVETRNRNGRTSLAIRRSAATSGHCKIRRGDTELVLQQPGRQPPRGAEPKAGWCTGAVSRDSDSVQRVKAAGAIHAIRSIASYMQ